MICNNTPSNSEQSTEFLQVIKNEKNNAWIVKDG